MKLKKQVIGEGEWYPPHNTLINPKEVNIKCQNKIYSLI